VDMLILDCSRDAGEGIGSEVILCVELSVCPNKGELKCLKNH